MLNKAERLNLMQEVDPGDIYSRAPLYGQPIDEYNREAREFAINSYNQITSSYKSEINECKKNSDYNKLVELIKEIDDIIINDPNGWGPVLSKKFFKWVSE